MRIRLRSTGAVMFEDELRAYMRANNGPSWDRTTPEVLEALGADVVFPTPQPAFDPVIRVAREIAPQQTANGNLADSTAWAYFATGMDSPVSEDSSTSSV